MAPTAERNVQDQSSSKDVGRNLRHVRKQQGLSRGAAARSAGLTRRELAQYERGKVDVPESDLWCLAGSCGVDVSELLPRREPLRVSPDLSTISTGDTIRHLRGPAEPDGLLREYLAMIYELRNLPPGSPVPLREPDLTALADALGGTPANIEHRLIEIIGASPEEAGRIRAMILLPLSLPSAAQPEPPRADPYAALAKTETPPAVEDFFASPPATDLLPSPLLAATASPFTTSTGPPPSSDLSPSDPFGGPVDPLGTAASALHDPFGPPPVDDPLAPSPLPPDPFAAAPVTLGADPGAGTAGVDDPIAVAAPEPHTASPFGVTPSGNGHHAPVDDPFAPHWETETARGEPRPPADSLGINVMDAIVVDDPLAPAPDGSAPTLTAPPVAAAVAPIAWNADQAPEPPITASSATPEVDSTPRFERASAHWQVGGIFPAMAMADDGTLALRPADARWALTDLRASGDCIIEAVVDFRAGSGFGIVFRGAVDDGDRITGYSFDIDPIAGGGGYLLRLWEDSRQHWRPLVQAPVTDAAQLYGRHVVRLALRADQLTVAVDGDTVLDLPALSRATVDLGRQPCRGDRVGVQAWSTTEVTVDSFRVASL
jgi:transcriptional regulator with XRE-family HTH domain